MLYDNKCLLLFVSSAAKSAIFFGIISNLNRWIDTEYVMYVLSVPSLLALIGKILICNV